VAIGWRGAYFVTGAAGFFGRRFLEAIRHRQPDATLRVLVHRRPVPPVEKVEALRGDLDDALGLESLLRGIDTVVHFAAVTHASSRDEYFRVNARGTANLVLACRRAGVRRFVLVSSRAVHPGCGDYGRSKHAAEDAVRAGGMPYVILRCAEVYGPGSAEGLNALLAALRRAPVVPYPAGGAPLAPLHLDDAVAAVVEAAIRSYVANETYTLAGPRTYTVGEVLGAACRLWGVRPLRVPVPLPVVGVLARALAVLGRPVVRYDQVSRLRCPKESDIEKARRDLGFSPRSLEEGLRQIPLFSGQGGGRIRRRTRGRNRA
jgi:NADH dehydrogenase